MAAVTAYILVGHSHPNETSLDPRWIIKLWEGSTANWVATPIDFEAPNSERRPRGSEEILEAGCEFALGLAAEHGLDSVAVCPLDESSISQDLAQAGDLLPHLNVYLMRSVGTRTTSQWREGWHTTGELS